VEGWLGPSARSRSRPQLPEEAQRLTRNPRTRPSSRRCCHGVMSVLGSWGPRTRSWSDSSSLAAHRRTVQVPLRHEPVARGSTTVVSVLVSIHTRPAPFTSGHPDRVRVGRGRWRPPVNAGLHCWKACWGQPLKSSNLLSPASLTRHYAAFIAHGRGNSSCPVSITVHAGSFSSRLTSGYPAFVQPLECCRADRPGLCRDPRELPWLTPARGVCGIGFEWLDNWDRLAVGVGLG